jgi:uncharacterized membrane protein YraQ (UPF0718 family)
VATLEQRIARRYPKRRIGFIVALVAVGIVLHDHLLDAALFALSNLWQIAPIVIAGLVVTAVLTATGSIGLLVATFDTRALLAIVMVSLVGAMLPVCGITLLPLVAGLLSAGMPLAPVMAFLLSSAVTDPSMFAITAATLGLPFAAAKTVAAFGIGVFGGGITWAAVRIGWFHRPMRSSSMFPSLVPESACCGPTETIVCWRFWDDTERVALFKATCWSMAKLVVLFLSVAFVAEYYLKLYLPEDALSGFVGRDNPLAVPIAAIVGAPLYLDGYAALPFVRGLIDRGMAESAAMAFLIAGGITSAWTAIPVFALVRLPVFLAYIVMAVVGSMLSGWAYAIAVA